MFLSGKKGGMEISLEARPQKRNVSPQHPQHSTLKSHPPKLSASCSDLLQGDPWGNLAAPQWGPPSERALFLANRLCFAVFFCVQCTVSVIGVPEFKFKWKQTCKPLTHPQTNIFG